MIQGTTSSCSTSSNLLSSEEKFLLYASRLNSAKVANEKRISHTHMVEECTFTTKSVLDIEDIHFSNFPLTARDYQFQMAIQTRDSDFRFY